MGDVQDFRAGAAGTFSSSSTSSSSSSESATLLWRANRPANKVNQAAKPSVQSTDLRRTRERKNLKTYWLAWGQQPPFRPSSPPAGAWKPRRSLRPGRRARVLPRPTSCGSRESVRSTNQPHTRPKSESTFGQEDDEEEGEGRKRTVSNSLSSASGLLACLLLLALERISANRLKTFSSCSLSW